MESEILCEVGSWKNYEEMEDELVLDELFLLYEKTSERQQRLMKTVAAAMGADVSDTPTGDEIDTNLQYEKGEIASEGAILFGYRNREAAPGEF